MISKPNSNGNRGKIKEKRYSNYSKSYLKLQKVSFGSCCSSPHPAQNTLTFHLTNI